MANFAAAGWPAAGAEQRLAGAGCVVLVGANIGESVEVPLLRGLARARSAGATVIVVDPRFSVAASKADEHLMIRPGTDTALVIGWLRHIIDARLYNFEHASRLTGFSELQDHVRRHSLEDVAAITDLPVDVIKKTARAMAAAAPSTVFLPGRFSAWHGGDVQRLRALLWLSALLGAPAAAVPPQPEKSSRPSHALIGAALKGDIHCLGLWGVNPLQACVNPYRVREALRRVDFVFCSDIYPGEAAMFADIVLPEAAFLERTDLRLRTGPDGTRFAALSLPALPPRFERREPFWIVRQLAVRLGRPGFDERDAAARVAREVRELGLDWPTLQQEGIAPLPGPPPVRRSRAAAIPLPRFRPVPLPPEGYARLLSGRSPVHTMSGTMNNPWLHHEEGENVLWLNDRAAKSMGVADGARLYIENQDGVRSVRPVMVKVTPGIRPDCVYLPHGFGVMSPLLSRAFNAGVSDAAMITRSVPDPVSGVRGIRVNHVRLVALDGTPLAIPRLDEPPAVLRDASRWWFDAFGSHEPGARRSRHV